MPHQDLARLPAKEAGELVETCDSVAEAHGLEPYHHQAYRLLEILEQDGLKEQAQQIRMAVAWIPGMSMSTFIGPLLDGILRHAQEVED